MSPIIRSGIECVPSGKEEKLVRWMEVVEVEWRWRGREIVRARTLSPIAKTATAESQCIHREFVGSPR